MNTLKQKLTAIKGSIEKWDKISKREMKDEGENNCPLCAVFLVPGGDTCRGCPIFEKTGKELCDGTPHRDFVVAEDRENAVVTPWQKGASRQMDATDVSARKFRDWLKDLYIEVSEAGDGGDTFKKWLEEYSIYKEEGEKPKVNESILAASILRLTERIEKLEERPFSHWTGK